MTYATTLPTDCPRSARKVFSRDGTTSIYRLTVCTKNNQPWLTQPDAHQALLAAWEEADTWMVGHYLLMPDHVHLFCAPHLARVDLGHWVRFWQSHFRSANFTKPWEWARNYCDTRLHDHDDYTAKWEYTQQNPIRHGHVETPEDWPYQGQLNDLEA